MKKILLLSLIIIAGCSSSSVPIGMVKIKGSDTMLILTEMLAEEYMSRNPGVSIYVEGGGTSAGVKSLISGEVDICTASRSLNPDEAKSLADYYGSLGMYFLIAKDALSIYINPDNEVKNISSEDLKKIFTCQITNWKELGGNDAQIIPIIRTPNSGTYFYFKEHILSNEDYCPTALVANTTEDVIKIIDKNKNAIGFGGIGYQDDVFHAYIDDIRPSENNARNDTYPITRYLHFFTSKTPSGVVKNFIDWVLSPEGQKVVQKAGFIPLWELSF
ncbi:MAG: phosphate-binding protein [Ignavibacteriae bacterium]|nr:phosphate-binding protein [Ignavibacteriota bacterium]